MNSLSDIAQLLRSRRIFLNMEQKDMYMLIGMKQQQYQRIETGSDVKLSTLLRVLEGLNLELTLSPKESVQYPTPSNQSNFKIQENVEDNGDDLEFWLGSESSHE